METCSFIKQNSVGQKILRVINVHVATDFHLLSSMECIKELFSYKIEKDGKYMDINYSKTIILNYSKDFTFCCCCFLHGANFGDK